MANYDLAVGIGANQVNSASVEVHRIAYPGPFQGALNTTLPVLNVPVTVSWDIKEPLNVNLPTDPQDADLQVTLPFVEAGISASTFPKTSVRLGTELDVDVTINDGGQVALLPKKVTVSSADLGTPLQTILDNLLLPAALNVYGSSLPKIQLPPLQVQGLNVSPPKTVTQSNHLIGVATLASKGASSLPAAGSSWPASDLFVLLSNDALTAAATVALTSLNRNLKDHGSAGFLGFGVEWHYDVILSDPQVSVVDQSLRIGFSMSGTTGAGFTVPIFGAADIPFNIVVTPEPTATAHFSIDPTNAITATIESVDSFAIFLTPSGDVVQWITGAMIASAVDLIVPALTLAITTFLKNISFKVFQVPDITVNELGVSVAIHPHNLSVSGFNGMLAVTGTVDLAHG